MCLINMKAKRDRQTVRKSMKKKKAYISPLLAQKRHLLFRSSFTYVGKCNTFTCSYVRRLRKAIPTFVAIQFLSTEKNMGGKSSFATPAPLAFINKKLLKMTYKLIVQNSYMSYVNDIQILLYRYFVSVLATKLCRNLYLSTLHNHR